MPLKQYSYDDGSSPTKPSQLSAGVIFVGIMLLIGLFSIAAVLYLTRTQPALGATQPEQGSVFLSPIPDTPTAEPTLEATATIVATPTAAPVFPEGYSPLPTAMKGGYEVTKRDQDLNKDWPFKTTGNRQGDNCEIQYATDITTDPISTVLLWVDCQAVGEPEATAAPVAVPAPVYVAPTATPAPPCKDATMDGNVYATVCGWTAEERDAQARAIWAQFADQTNTANPPVTITPVDVSKIPTARP